MLRAGTLFAQGWQGQQRQEARARKADPPSEEGVPREYGLPIPPHRAATTQGEAL
jgi:hypothetical protein